ncbi:MAG TPA: P-loop NTPase [Chloroflexota bacterium]|nr:P-loop NTPase [Chloroflexota bacterium]
MASEIRVLLVEETKYRADLNRLLRGDAITLVAEAGFGTEAVTMAQETTPDVVVLSLEEPIARPLRTLEILTAALPTVGVVAVSSINNRDVMRKAMRTGARDFLTKPVGHDDLQRAIAAVYEAGQKKQTMSEVDNQKDLRTGDLLVLFGGKGGIGKTTISVNLATAIAIESKQRVALVDLDVQMGDVALMLSVVPERSIVDAAMSADRLESEYLQSLLYTDRTGIRLLPAPASPEESAEVTAVQIGQVLDALVRTFDYVIVDTAPVLNDINLTALQKATLILLLTTPELPSLKRTKISLGLLLKAWNFSEERIKLLVNYPYTHNGVMLSDMESTLDYPIFWKIPYDVTVAQSVKAGRPCVEAKPNARFSRNMTDLARSICGLNQPSRGILSLLWQR